jgi:hypothetical protein
MYFSTSLPFDREEDRDDSEFILLNAMGIVARLNKMHLRRSPDTPLLYESGVVYTKPDQSDGRPPLKRGQVKKLLQLIRDMGQEPETALMVIRILKGIEIFLDIPALYKRGKGDCNELVPVRVAELWRAGISASPYLTKQARPTGGYIYHAIVQYPDGSSEDPSLILGMHGPEGADARREEIRKNVERYGTHIAEAQRMLEADSSLAPFAAKQIDQMGFVPRGGVFKSPYDRVAP